MLATLSIRKVQRVLAKCPAEAGVHRVDPQDSASQFQTTSWTLVLQARASKDALETLLGRYWSPIYAYLRRKGKPRDEAADLTQDFLTDVVLRRDLIGRARPEHGRFRTYLLAALRNFLIDAHRKQHGRKGNRPQLVPTDTEVLERADPSQDDDPSRAFDRQWATAMLEVTLDQVERSCRQLGLMSHWNLFEQRVLLPIREGMEPPTLDELAKDTEAPPEKISSMLHTVKRKFRKSLRDVIAETLENPEDVELELSLLREHLSIGG